MTDRTTIEKEIPERMDINDPWDLVGYRNSHKLLTLILEVLLDIRDATISADTMDDNE